MRHLLVLANPRPSSFGAQLGDRVGMTLSALGHAVQVRDLYARDLLHAGDRRLAPPSTVRAEVRRADVVHLVFPLAPRVPAGDLLAGDALPAALERWLGDVYAAAYPTAARGYPDVSAPAAAGPVVERMAGRPGGRPVLLWTLHEELPAAGAWSAEDPRAHKDALRPGALSAGARVVAHFTGPEPRAWDALARRWWLGAAATAVASAFGRGGSVPHARAARVMQAA